MHFSNTTKDYVRGIEFGKIMSDIEAGRFGSYTIRTDNTLDIEKYLKLNNIEYRIHFPGIFKDAIYNGEWAVLDIGKPNEIKGEQR